MLLITTQANGGPPAIYAIGIGFGSGSDSGDAARKATAECAQRSPNPDKCNSYGCRTGKCGAVAVAGKKPPYRGFNDSGGDSKAEAINEVMSLCQVTEQNPARWESVTGIRYPGCHLLEAACPDDGVTQVADAAGAASDSVSRYGVFAFDIATGAAGFSVWHPNQSSAEQRALSECAQHGGQNCTIYRRFPNRCAALARADEQGRWARGYGHADSKAAAVDLALSECRNQGVGVCCLYDSVCGQQR